MLRRENLDSNLRLLSGSLSNEPVEGATAFDILRNQGYATDKFPQVVLAMLANSAITIRKRSLAECTDDQGELRF